MQNQEEIFEKPSVPKALCTFMVPALLSQLVSLILNLTDTYFVGKTCDTAQISAMTMCFPIVMVFTCVSTILGAGGNVNFAASISRKEYKSAEKYSVFSVYTAIVLAAVLSFALFLFQTGVFRILGATGKIGDHSKAYVLWTVHIGCVPLCFSAVIAQIFMAEGRTKAAGTGLAGAGILNAVLDPVFIFILDMGVEGAAIATCIADYASAAYFLIMYWRRKESSISLDIRKYTVRDAILKNTVMIGIPSGMTIILLNLCDFTRNNILANMSTATELAAWGTAEKLANAFMMVILGFTQGGRPLIAYNYAQKNLARTRSLIRGTLLVVLLYSLCVLVFISFFRKNLVWAFLPIEDAAEKGAEYIHIWSIGIIGIAFVETLNIVFQCVDHWKLAILDSLAGKMLMLILIIVLPHIIGVTGVVVSQPIADIATGIFVILLYVRIILPKFRGC